MKTARTRPNKIRQVLVADIMATDIVSVRPGDAVHEALELLLANHVSALPVVNRRGRCVGVISATDILNLTQEVEDELVALSKSNDGFRHRAIERIADSELATQSVQEGMSRDVVCVKPSNTIQEAAAEMVRHQVHRVMVSDEEQRLVGIVSTMDVMRAVAKKHN